MAKKTGLMFPNTPKIQGPTPVPGGKPLGARKLSVRSKAAKGVSSKKVF